MVDYTWFRLLVRGFGVGLVGLALPGLVSGIIEIAAQIISLGQGGRGLGWNFYFALGGHLLGSVVQCGFGVYLFFGAQWVIERSLRGVYGHCAACGYDVREHRGVACPECGVVLPGRRLPDQAGGGASGDSTSGDAASVGRAG